MAALFVALGIAVITLLALLLWFVPHLLHQQALRSTREAGDLRDMLLDMLNEQETVTKRQTQLSTSIAYLQDQLQQIVGVAGQKALGSGDDPATLRLIEERIGTMQHQIQSWLDTRTRVQRNTQVQDNEAWANLMGLLAAIQERVGTLSAERSNISVGLQARVLLEELEQEMLHLHTISDDIATLQWRLRRSLNERESNLATLRESPPAGN